MEVEADLIFATSSTPLTISLPAVPVSRKKKIPMVFEVRDLWLEVPITMDVLNNSFPLWAVKKPTASVVRGNI